MSGHLKGVINIGIFKRKKKIEKRAESPSVLTLEGLVAYGTKITREQALEIPTVAACVGKLADTVARLPIHLHQKVDDKVVEVKGDPRLKQLNGETGDAMNAVEMWTAALSDYFLGRGAWIYIEPQFEGLHYVDSRSVGIISNADPIFKQFCVNINGQNYYDWQFIKLLRKTRNGWDNVPIQEESATIFSAAYNSIKLENQMNVNGGCKPGFLKSSHTLTKEAADMIRENYNSMYSNDGGSQKGKVVVLNEGIDFQAVTNTAVELQMNENKKVNSIEICKLFGFPHTIIDGGASEEDKKQFISVVVSIVNRIETVLDTVMLYEDEKEKGYYWSFDTRELTRGNMKERYEAYAIALENHFLQIDEVRREEDYEPVGFNFVTMGLGDILLNPETMEVFTPNTGQTSNLLTGESRAEDIELRYNHNHDSKGRFASGSGGGGSLKPVDKSNKNLSKPLTPEEKKRILKEKIDSGEMKTNVDVTQQPKHQYSKFWKNQVKQSLMPGSKQKPRSVLAKGAVPEELVKKYSLTGRVELSRDGSRIDEFVNTPDFIGRTYDSELKRYVKTKTLQIRYTKKGIHVFPTIKKEA